MDRGKYLIIQGDGMGDYPLPELEGATPLEAANTPYMDELAPQGELGLAATIPAGMEPGSDIGNMSILGYDPRRFYTGRAPLEARGMGIGMDKDDVAYRCNLVTLEENPGGRRMVDYSAGHISTESGGELISRINESLGSSRLQFHPGTGYRHLLIWKGGRTDLRLTPPHDITGERIDEFMPEGEGDQTLIRLIKDSWEVLKEEEANSIWFWGCGKPPQLPPLVDKNSSGGFVISAVDLIRGLGTYAGLVSIQVPKVTGFIDTNYKGKVEASLKAFKTHDFGFLHLEAPDEASHLRDLETKIKAIEYLDNKIVGPIWEGLREYENFSILLLTDHYTPISTGSHSDEPVPYLIYRNHFSESEKSGRFNEKSASSSGMLIEPGYRLLGRFLGNEGLRREE